MPFVVRQALLLYCLSWSFGLLLPVSTRCSMTKRRGQVEIVVFCVHSRTRNRGNGPGRTPLRWRCCVDECPIVQLEFLDCAIFAFFQHLAKSRAAERTAAPFQRGLIVTGRCRSVASLAGWLLLVAFLSSSATSGATSPRAARRRMLRTHKHFANAGALISSGYASAGSSSLTMEVEPFQVLHPTSGEQRPTTKLELPQIFLN